MSGKVHYLMDTANAPVKGTPADRTEALLPILISLAVDIVSQLQSNSSGDSVLAGLNSSSEAVLRAISCKASLANQTRASICTKSTVPSPFRTPGSACRTYCVSCKPMDAPQSNVHVKILQILDRFHPSCKIRLISALGQTYLPSDSNERKTESSQACGLKVSSVMNRELPKGNTWFTNTGHSGAMSYFLGRQPRTSYLWGVIGVQDQRLGNR
ncbi:hypothetical protein KL939_002130 [Ogataea angusta]|nr:hypothetical protein KL939_002130 [Ogataea angusta]